MAQDNSNNSSNALVGGLVILVIFMVLAYMLYQALPFLVSLTTNILSFVIGLLVIAGVLFILLHPRTRFGIGSLINSIFRKK